MEILRWFILLIPGILSAQGIYDFEEGSLDAWGQSPATRWEISAYMPLNGAYSLHHAFDNPGTGEDLVFLDVNYPQSSDTLGFSFRVRHSYNPSRGNNWQFYFLSLLPDQLENCMVFGVNFRGSDDTLKLWQVIDGEESELINTGINYEEVIGRTAAPHFILTRIPGGSWSIKMDISGEGSDKMIMGSGEELVFSAGKYLGVRYAYSSAQDRKLWVDDIYAVGSFEKDERAPSLDTVAVIGLNSIKLGFDESILLTDSTHFDWDGLSPDSMLLSSKEIQLVFPENFPNRQIQYMTIHAIEDMEGNMLQDTLVEFCQNLVEYGEVVITEIMCDPDPIVYLPACEYVELFNNTEFNIDLSAWLLSVNSKLYFIDEGEILPGEYLILSSYDTQQFFEGKKVLEIFSSPTALSNSGAELRLFDQYSRLIHRVIYREMEKYDALKSDGGWSLECIDPDWQCGGSENWKVSQHHSGGTPGASNSVKEGRDDVIPPEITFIGIADTNAVSIHFSEPVFLSEESDHSFNIKGHGSVKPVFYTTPLVNDVIELVSKKPFREGDIFTVELANISDCEGNSTGKLQLEFGLPKIPSVQMIVFNEVMYDPIVGWVEYLEFYNISDHYLDLKDMKISVSGDAYSVGSGYPLGGCSHLIPPKQYVAVCANEGVLRDQWELDLSIDVVEISAWKTLPNEEGYIDLLNRSDIFMERLHYHDSLHHDLLRDPAGVSLERISAEHTASTWTSASASVSYGTPGTENSQKSKRNVGGGIVELYPSVISPDLDGYNDFAEVTLRGFPAGSCTSIYITDINGYEVNTIIENAILGGEDSFYWDAHDMDHHLVFPGIYIVHVRVYGETKEQIFRKSCALTYR